MGSFSLGRACLRARRVSHAGRRHDTQFHRLDLPGRCGANGVAASARADRQCSGEASISLITTENFEKPIDVWLARYNSACVELRLRHYARPETNPVVRAAATIEPLCVVSRRQFLTDREFKRDPACQATLIAQDLYHGCIAPLHRTGPLLSALEVYRPRRARDFAASELRMLGRLVPHIANALRVNWYVGASQTHQRQAEEALNQLNAGLFLLENDGRSACQSDGSGSSAQGR